MNLPFTEINHNGYVTRGFDENTPEEEFVWHRDREDRIVEPIHKTDWKLQLEDELPSIIQNPIFIKRELFHRLIKGTGNLQLKITKLH